MTRSVHAPPDTDGDERLLVGLDEELCFSLYAASMAMGRLYKPMLDELGLTYPQYLVLHTLWEEDGRTVGVIADRLGLESSTATPLVQRLESAGFVRRERGREDERQVFVRLSNLGRETEARTVCLVEAVRDRTGMRLADVRALAADVQTLRRKLQPHRAD